MKNINLKRLIERILFSTKWMLIPFYLGLMAALIPFLIVDLKEVYHLVTESNGLDKTTAMMFILELVDMAMIAALVRMIIIGGYTSFVCKNHSEDGEKSSSGVLKVKLGTALIGVSSINLLQTFISCMNSKCVAWDVLAKQLSIHGAFLLGAIVLAIIDYLHVKAEVLHHEEWDKGKSELEVCEPKMEKKILTEHKH
jgi:uncharacterized protein (TIGR00645 family)